MTDYQTTSHVAQQRPPKLPSALRYPLMVVLPIAVIFVGAFGMRVLSSMMQEPPQKPLGEAIVPLVDATTVEEIPDYHYIVRSQGNVVARRESSLIPQIGGRVTKVSPALADGGFFQPKQPLLWVDDADYKVAVANAKLSVAQAKRRLAQEQVEADVAVDEWRKLGRTGPVPDLVARVPQLAEARAAVDAAEAALERANADLTRTEVLAPDYPGRVDSVSVNVGQTVTPGAPVAGLYAIDAVEVRLPLALDDLEFLDLPLFPNGPKGPDANGEMEITDTDREFDGPQVTLVGRIAGSSWTWNGRIVRTEGRVDPRTRFIYAIARVDDPYARDPGQDGRPPLMVGLYVNAAIDGRSAGRVIRLDRSVMHEGIDVETETPDEDDVTAGAGRFELPSVVYRIDGAGRLQFREVQVLRRTVDHVYVRANENLQHGDRIITSPLPTAVNNMKVRVRGDAPAPMPPAAPANAAGAGANTGGGQ